MTTFPLAETGLRLRLDLDGSGSYATDITDYLLTTPTEAVSIGRGLQSDGSSQTCPPSSMSFTLKNDDGRFTLRNVNGPYYGQLVRNTAVRADIPHIVSRADIPSGVGPGLSTPDTAGLSITGDLDVRIDLEMPDWRANGLGTSILHKWVPSGNQRSWALYVMPSGQLRVYWSTDGGTATFITSNATIPRGPKRQTLRVTVDVDNGSGGSVWTWYSGTSKDAVSWTQIGSALTTGSTSFFDSTAVVGIGDTSDGTKSVPMTVYGVQIRSGIGGTIKADLDLTGIAEGATTVTDAQGGIWTPTAPAALVTRDVLFTGVVPSWTPRAGLLASADTTLPVTAYDDRRRLDRSKALSLSAYRRGVQTLAAGTVAGYWPMEDPAGSTSYASGLTGGNSGRLYGSPALASDSTSFPCAGALPVFDSASKAGGSVTQAGTAQSQARILFRAPAAGVSTLTRVLTISGRGSAPTVSIWADATGNLTTIVTDELGATIVSSGTVAYAINGKSLRIGLAIQQSGSDVLVTTSTLEVGATVGSFSNVTATSKTWLGATSWAVGADAGLNGCTVGELVIQPVVTSIWELSDQLNAYSGETAPARVRRVLTDAGMTVVQYGSKGQPLGPQPIGRLIDILTDAESSDDGILFSLPDRRGLGYRSSDSMSARDSVLTVAYSAAGIPKDGLQPADDDQGLANDVVASRPLGSQARYTVSSGPLSVLDPPNGAGPYEAQVPANLQLDDDLLDRAAWAAHRGTVDESRWPTVTFDLASAPYITGTATAQQAAIRDLEIGDRITITGLPDQLGGGSADVIVIGLQTKVAPWSHVITAVCRPASPWRVMVWGASRYDSTTTTVNGAHAQGATSLSVAIAGGPLWGHGSGDYDITIGGRTMTVTGVSGATSPQTMTIPGGLPAALSGGESVRLATPSYWSLS